MSRQAVEGLQALRDAPSPRPAYTTGAADRVRAQPDCQVALVALQRALRTLPLPADE